MNAAEVKSALPIPFVLDRAGIAYEVGADGRCHARCPFHDDRKPSFDVYGERLERWGCYPCGKGGDVFDLLEALGLAECYQDALELAEWMVGLLGESEWRGPTASIPRQEFDFGKAASIVTRARHDLSGLERFLKGRDMVWDAENLHREWAVGSIGDRVIIPYFTSIGKLMAYKWRTPDTKPVSAAGSQFTGLYGEWRDDPDRYPPVLLVEGETDTWTADLWVGGEWSVLGVPTGSGTHPDRFASRLEGRLVVVAFDGDVAGRRGAHQWASHLDGKVVPMPDGMDVADVGPGIGALIEQAEAPRPNAFLDRFFPS